MASTGIYMVDHENSTYIANSKANLANAISTESIDINAGMAYLISERVGRILDEIIAQAEEVDTDWYEPYEVERMEHDLAITRDNYAIWHGWIPTSICTS